jgi:hypothetical protein
VILLASLGGAWGMILLYVGVGIVRKKRKGV